MQGPRLRPATQITAVGTAVPPDSYSQQDILDLYRIEDAGVRSLFHNSAIGRRHLSLPPRGAGGIPRSETQGELLHRSGTGQLLAFGAGHNLEPDARFLTEKGQGLHHGSFHASYGNCTVQGRVGCGSQRQEFCRL